MTTTNPSVSRRAAPLDPHRVATAPWIGRKTLLVLIVPPVLLIIAAWAQWLIAGLPFIPPHPHLTEATTHQPYGFPAWIRIIHYINLLFMLLLARSGLQILVEHPQLYWNVHSTPGTEWLRFTRVRVPLDRLYTANDDELSLTPWIGLPGGKHTLGIARYWHFSSALFWTLNGAIYITLLSTSGHWARIVPTSWSIFPQAWAVFVHYATFHLPPEPNGYFHYNALQQHSYFGVIFILAPLSILTGPAMSPALVNRFSWYRRLPANRQVARSIHFLLLCAYIAFVIVHVSMVFITGFGRNMNHIVLGTNNFAYYGMYIGITGIIILFLINVMANWASWLFPRKIQHIGDAIVNPVQKLLLDRHAPRAQYTPEDISPYHWANGKLPTSEEYKSLVANNFKHYRLKAYGLVENPVELSLDDLHNIAKRSQITLHNCIQGWSGIAEWGGPQLSELMKIVRSHPEVKCVIFYSFGEGIEGGEYYDTHTIENVRHPQTILAYEMNYKPLTEIHGAPLRLRVENQLGFKMVKWIKSIEFAKDFRHVHQGEGGYNSDHIYFDTMADI